jgi:hypothetical protein
MWIASRFIAFGGRGHGGDDHGVEPVPGDRGKTGIHEQPIGPATGTGFATTARQQGRYQPKRELVDKQQPAAGREGFQELWAAGG